MSYSPLKINTLGALIQQTGLQINPQAVGYMGSSTSLSNYTPGTVVGTTCLFGLTNAIRLAYTKIGINPTTNVAPLIYSNLIAIGSGNIAALGNSPPNTYELTYTGEITSHGWLRLPALLAYQEFFINNGSYQDFLNSFNICEAKKNQLNVTISSLYNSLTYLDGVYSNMNDLMTGDISGVSLSTFYFGQDLIASGRAIDLSRIDVFGNPQALLQNIYKNQALTKALNLTLLSAGLTSTVIQQLCTDTEASVEQLKVIYAAFTLIVGSDLRDICIPLNCQTRNLSSLADLLNPKKLFPNSYITLTYPIYNSISLPTNSKTYYLIYSGGEVNIQTNTNIGKRLYNIIPTDIGYAADAFSIAMMQIKNIQTANIEKFSQVVRNLENTNGLTGVNGTNVPTNKPSAQAGLAAIAKGTGTGGTYTTCNFFGSMTNIYYDWKQLQELINLCATPALALIYLNMNNLLLGPGPYNTQLQTLIQNAITEIDSIYAANPLNANKLIDLYNNFGFKYKAEVQARALVLPDLVDLTSDNTDIISFVETLDAYASNTESEGAALVLKDIANINEEGGNFIIAAMREARNAQRLGLAGLELDNDVNGTDNSNLQLPPVSGQTLANDPILGYENTKGSIANVPIITGAATTPGSLAGSPETTLVPDNLSILVQPSDESVLTPEQAIETVVLCNCDCWDLI